MKKKITVKDFAISIGVPPTTLYSFIKRDSATAKLDLLTKICRGLSIDLASLFDFTFKNDLNTDSDEYRSDLEYTKSLLSSVDTWNHEEIEKFASFLLQLDQTGLENFYNFISLFYNSIAIGAKIDGKKV